MADEEPENITRQRVKIEKGDPFLDWLTSDDDEEVEIDIENITL